MWGIILVQVMAAIAAIISITVLFIFKSTTNMVNVHQDLKALTKREKWLSLTKEGDQQFFITGVSFVMLVSFLLFVILTIPDDVSTTVIAMSSVVLGFILPLLLVVMIKLSNRAGNFSRILKEKQTVPAGELPLKRTHAAGGKIAAFTDNNDVIHNLKYHRKKSNFARQLEECRTLYADNPEACTIDPNYSNIPDLESVKTRKKPNGTDSETQKKPNGTDSASNMLSETESSSSDELPVLAYEYPNPVFNMLPKTKSNSSDESDS